jgi:hypothetical protein
MQRVVAVTELQGTTVREEDDDMVDATVTELLPDVPVAAPVKIRKVQCIGGSESFGQVSDALPVDANDALQHIMGFWEKMVASRPASDPRSMFHPRAMRHVVIGNSDGMVDLCMVKAHEVDTDDAGGDSDVKMQGAYGAAGR